MKTVFHGIAVILIVMMMLSVSESCSKSTNTNSNTKPSVTTNTATELTYTTAKLNGVVNASGQIASVVFQYGLTSNYDHSAIALQGVAMGDTNTMVSCFINGLEANNTYHFRVKAVTAKDTIVSSDLTFNTPAYDLDGLWEATGYYELQISGSIGTFTSITSGNWLGELNAGYVSIGSDKLKNITAQTDSTWTCDDLWWHETGGVYDYVNWSDAGSGSISISADGNTLSITSSSGSYGAISYYLTRVNSKSAVVIDNKVSREFRGSGN